ncbi:MAG: hypothetical protein Alpg2KO_02220 [Alphaproteobacteria bacterium]
MLTGMKIAFSSFAVAALALAMTALPPASAKAQSLRGGCPNMSPPKLDIRIDPGEATIDGSRNLAYIKSISDASHALHKEVLGLSVATLDAQRRTTFAFGRPRSGRGLCASIQQLEIRIRLKDRRVYIAEEVQRSRCLTNFVRTHEFKHVAVDERVMNNYLPQWQAAMRTVLRQTHKTWGSSQDDAIARIESQLDRAFNNVFNQMRRDQARLQALIDNGGDYQRVNTVCDGVANKILGSRRR